METGQEVMEQAQIILFFTGNSFVRINLEENDWYNVINHIDDLKEIFPGEDFTVF